MRLIDADEIKDIIDGNEEFIDLQKREICECIDACDTTYDVDKVVEELEEHSGFALKQRGVFYLGAKMAFREAIEIVKKGGK